jgi:hypothetical protein
MTPAELLLMIGKLLADLSPLQLKRIARRRKAAADLLERVAEVIGEIVDAYKNGVEPVSECNELHRYAQQLERVLRGTLGWFDRGQAKYLANQIEAATEVPHSAFFDMRKREGLIYRGIGGKLGASVSDVSDELDKLKGASGEFRAAATLMRAT